MTHEQLERYISKFHEHQRETIYKQILDSELLKTAFETREGKMILNNAVDLITSNVISIVTICSDGGENDALRKHSTEINTTYKLMTEWAKIIIRGSEHKDKAEKEIQNVR
ncbi:MAG: hypothetical protein ACYSU8_06400 [Planctomycetota bacterium]|jgi:predicted PolB exonuclease-like 3'-5' exonuclease